MVSATTVLIVDDDSDILNRLVDILLKEGFYRAIGTATGEDVRGIIRRKNPDIVLLDVDIGAKDSIKLLMEIKAENSSLPVVMLADEGHTELAKKALTAGASSFITKSALLSGKVDDVKREMGRSTPLKIGRKATILIVDDDKVNAEMVESYLRSEGYTCYVSHNSRQALELVKARRPNIVLLDIVMPGMDGVELLSRIRDMNREIIVVMMTGVADKQVCADAMFRGASGYITKPFSLQQLKVSVVTSLLTD